MLKHEEVVTLVSKRLNVPRELVHTVMVDFWHNLKYALSHPDIVFRRGIRIKNCFKIKYNPTKILQELEGETTFRPCSNKRFQLLNINNYLLENEIYSEKQSKIAKEYQRSGHDLENLKRDCFDAIHNRFYGRDSISTEEE